jgi:GMP synthase (glutamine-hydrolysing)
VRSVGVQGDSRTYRGVLAFDELIAEDKASELVNRSVEVNRVIGRLGSHTPLSMMRVTAGLLTPERLERLRAADAAVRELTSESGFDRAVWQLPVILIPVGTGDLPDSVVLRPVHSVDGMTAQVVIMPAELRRGITRKLLGIAGVCGVFYDLTHKPPGTIEWE